MVKKGRRNNILCIEDDADIRIFACRVLELEGYCCLQAGTGKEAFRLLKENKVDLVLLDLRLAETDGWLILEQMKSDPELSVIPVIVCTASFAEPQRERAMKMGAADYLVKPLSATVLRNAVTRILRRQK